MSINSLIANPNPVAPIAAPKFDDPLQQQANALDVVNAQNKLASSRQAMISQNALNAGYKYATDPTTGQVDPAKLKSFWAQNNVGSNIPAFQADQAKIALDQSSGAKNVADATKAQSEAIGKELGNVKTQLTGISTDPTVGGPQLDQYFQSVYKNPLLGPWMRSQGWTPEGDIQKKNAAIAAGPEAYKNFLQQEQLGVEGAMKMNENVVTAAKDGEGTRVFSTPKFGPGGSTQTASTALAGVMPQRAVTNVNVTNLNGGIPAETAYQKTRGEAQAKADDALAGAAQQAPIQAIRLKRMADLLHSGNVLVGPTGGMQLDTARYANALGMNENDPRIADTQDFIKNSQANLFNMVTQLKQQGLGSRVSNLEMKMLEKASTGQPLSREANLRIIGETLGDLSDTVNRNNARTKQVLGNPQLGGSQLGIPTVPPIAPYAPPMSIQLLHSGKVTPADFDSKYGAGAAAAYGVKQ